MKKDKPEAPTTQEDKYKAFLKRHLCKFQTAGRHCQMLAQHVDRGPESGLCGWHWINQDTPNLLQDNEEFVRYRNMDRQTYPKEWLQAFLYVDDAIVWACILGKEQRKEFVRVFFDSLLGCRSFFKFYFQVVSAMRTSHNSILLFFGFHSTVLFLLSLLKHSLALEYYSYDKIDSVKISGRILPTILYNFSTMLFVKAKTAGNKLSMKA